MGGSRDGKKPQGGSRGGAPHASTPKSMPAAASAPQPSSMSRGFARLDPETTAYFSEARETLRNLLQEGNREQASLLAGAALREAASPSGSRATTSDVVADAVASRALESLLPVASSEDVLDFARCVVANPETLGSVALRKERVLIFFQALTFLFSPRFLSSTSSTDPLLLPLLTKHQQPLRLPHRRGAHLQGRRARRQQRSRRRSFQSRGSTKQRRTRRQRRRRLDLCRSPLRA